MNKEEIYDREIAPLMTKITEICKQNKIGMIMSFAIPTPDDDDLSCTTALLRGEYSYYDRQVEAYKIIMTGQSIAGISGEEIA